MFVCVFVLCVCFVSYCVMFCVSSFAFVRVCVCLCVLCVECVCVVCL